MTEISARVVGVGETTGSATVQVQTALWRARWFLSAVLAQLVISSVLCGAARRAPLAGPLDAATTVIGAAVIFGSIALLLALFRERNHVSAELDVSAAYRQAWAVLRAERLTLEYLAGVAVILTGGVVALSAFSAAKQAIPALHPFSWDSRLAGLGAVLWGGHHLWQILQPALGRPTVTIILDWFYHRAWTAVLLASFVCAALMRPSQRRDRYLVALVLVFALVGNVAALAFASAGPAYFANVVGVAHNPYAPLLQYLRTVDARSPLMAVHGEGALWSAYALDRRAFGYGVSAMPSVHVATATTVALFGYSISRLLGVALSVAALGTLTGSVMLGWHYSLDGCVAMILALAIWWLAGWLISQRDPNVG